MRLAQRVLIHPEVAAPRAVQALAGGVVTLGQQVIAPCQQRALFEAEGVDRTQVAGGDGQCRQAQLLFDAVGVCAVDSRMILAQPGQQPAQKGALFLVGGHGNEVQRGWRRTGQVQAKFAEQEIAHDQRACRSQVDAGSQRQPQPACHELIEFGDGILTNNRRISFRRRQPVGENLGRIVVVGQGQAQGRGQTAAGRLFDRGGQRGIAQPGRGEDLVNGCVAEELAQHRACRIAFEVRLVTHAGQFQLQQQGFLFDIGDTGDVDQQRVRPFAGDACFHGQPHGQEGAVVAAERRRKAVDLHRLELRRRQCRSGRLAAQRGDEGPVVAGRIVPDHDAAPCADGRPGCGRCSCARSASATAC